MVERLTPTTLDADDASLGEVLKRARVAAEMTQNEVADAIGISRYTYIALENGRGLFHDEWLDTLPKPMVNPVVRWLQQSHREAINRLSKRLIPTIRRPTGRDPEASYEAWRQTV